MNLVATRSSLKNIEKFRSLFLQENNFQIRYNACHERQWSDSWLLSLDGLDVGYGSVKGKDNRVPAARCSIGNIGSRPPLFAPEWKFRGICLPGQ